VHGLSSVDIHCALTARPFSLSCVQIQETTEEMKPAKLRSSFLHGLPGPGHAVAIPRAMSSQFTSGRHMYSSQ